MEPCRPKSSYRKTNAEYAALKGSGILRSTIAAVQPTDDCSHYLHRAAVPSSIRTVCVISRFCECSCRYLVQSEKYVTTNRLRIAPELRVRSISAPSAFDNYPKLSDSFVGVTYLTASLVQLILHSTQPVEMSGSFPRDTLCSE